MFPLSSVLFFFPPLLVVVKIMEKKNCSAPYSVDDAKKERSRVLAHKRRATNRSVMDELTKVREGCGFGGVVK